MPWEDLRGALSADVVEAVFPLVFVQVCLHSYCVSVLLCEVAFQNSEKDWLFFFFV